MRIFATADTHFGHNNILNYARRPFPTIDEMDETIITNWNNVVGTDDLVVHLGDFAFASETRIREYRAKLNGKIILVEGNHDKTHRWAQKTRDLFDRVSKLDSIEIEGQHIVLSHYAMYVWDRSHFDSWCLFGHTHGTVEPVGKSMDVGVDSNAFTPVSFEQVKHYMEARKHNVNYCVEVER